jgi:hypothetical protein
MSLYILLSGLLFMFLAFTWRKDFWLNVCLKMAFTIGALWSAYMLLGPMNLITQL